MSGPTMSSPHPKWTHGKYEGRRNQSNQAVLQLLMPLRTQVSTYKPNTPAGWATARSYGLRTHPKIAAPGTGAPSSTTSSIISTAPGRRRHWDTEFPCLLGAEVESLLIAIRVASVIRFGVSTLLHPQAKSISLMGCSQSPMTPDPGSGHIQTGTMLWPLMVRTTRG